MYIPTKADVYVVRNVAVHSTEYVSLEHYHSVYQQEASDISQTGMCTDFCWNMY